MIYIRQININDNFNQYMKCVEDLNNASVNTANFEQMKRSLIERASNIITYVVVLDDIIVATATCIFERKIRYKQLCCHIEDVGVHPEYRKKGFGKMIMDHCIGVAKGKKCYKVKLFCSDHLLSFYAGMGFKKNNNGMEKVLIPVG